MRLIQARQIIIVYLEYTSYAETQAEGEIIQIRQINYNVAYNDKKNCLTES